MDRKELIKKYIDFFEKNEHVKIENSSLIPENDPTVLFTTAGMHPLVPFLSGEKHPSGKRLVGIQRCIRTKDIEEVGDTTHHTFFEMLGNWSLGDYWKEKALEMTFEFHTKVLGIPLDRYAVSVFKGNKTTQKDEESIEIWKKLGVKKERIALLEENWWGPAGKTGPCGPDTEQFFWAPKNIPPPEKFDPENKGWIEIGNNVLMEFYKDKEGKLKKANQKNIDFGGGVERTVAALKGVEDNYQLDCWKPIIKEIEKLSGKKYEEHKKEMRIVADHIKASVFIISDGITPSNTEQGYVLRRLIRRAIRFGRKIGMERFTKDIAKQVCKIYGDYNLNTKKIEEELSKEEEKFLKTLEQGLKIFKKIIKREREISGKKAFLLFQSYGFPIEMTLELAKENSIEVNEKEYEKEYEKHKKLSKTASAGKFKSGLADNSEKTTRLHTAAHLLLAALRKTLNKDISQKGSNINSERLRFDFNFDRKLTPEEKEKIEEIINEQIKKGVKVKREEMSLAEARKRNATGSFDKKYGEKVSVYTIGDFSKEICTGPHVKNTKELGKFKIIKEESSSAGIRRIKAILE
ncbi:alanine--tRNA ligase [Candidatus Pacearchaeota archaeon ex4484_71]|nr:MAG: alanine--tRNA ligase [Candidatus Pacearchaeota archaeon ex4484_71]